MGLNDTNKITIHSVKNTDCCRTGGFHSNCFAPQPSEEIASNEVPGIVPCYNGKTLKIDEELVENGLCAISIRHHNGNCIEERLGNENSVQSINSEKPDEKKGKSLHQKRLPNICYNELSKTNGAVPECLKDNIKRRNSFWNVHRPELSKLTWPENFVSSAVLQDFFHNHLRIHGTFCEPLHEFSVRSSLMDEEFRDYCKLRSVPRPVPAELSQLREIVPPRLIPPDEKVVNIMEKSRSVQLNDEDLDPETQVHKSRAEFCVTIGEYVRRPPLKRTTSQLVSKCVVQAANRFESLPLRHEGLLSKETMMSEERVSAVIGSTDFCANSSMRKNSKKLNSGIVLRRSSLVDSDRVVATSPPSLSNLQSAVNNSRTEGSRDQGRLRTILSPREKTVKEPGNRHYQV